jgi:hypothetical protein
MAEGKIILMRKTIIPIWIPYSEIVRRAGYNQMAYF